MNRRLRFVFISENVPHSLQSSVERTTSTSRQHHAETNASQEAFLSNVPTSELLR
ncbi:hypothetical protein RE6C_00262 [Rhodopirellula europaea 6C]|uniref:Uncharacterized protein n=1 Tax=Rhodopirellula europaea 6C TaxID=1263867 RepID=M2A9T9_9BACT|nr:hypothetical protein RE6C_00262 [Rhodopirellula europaea 6C]